MKKITDFIINKRYFVLAFFCLFTIISFVLKNYVVINYDMANYLPNSSSVRNGLDIMNSEFPEEDNSTLNLLVEGLSDDEKTKSYQYLAKLDNVQSINYDNTSSYNKDNYTLYELTLKTKADSSKTKDTYNEIKDYFQKKLVDISGSAANYNKDVLPFYIIALAVFSAFIILIIMCESYIEPVLYLTTILMAVILNSGTNIIFSSVSNITSSIAAILQMALSMDYSIMLMNRYRQERESEANKVEAMKNALHHAFKSISSSSVTTIVGLLALVFMSFKIGKDLGFVLAKGVLFSLLVIFTCLPALILIFDNLITKTKKKCPIFSIKSIGNVAYKLRYFSLFLFIAIFIGSYFLKGNLGILYTANENSLINEVFPSDNQIAIVYPTKEEEYISMFCNNNYDKVSNIACYSNTINLKLKESDLQDKLTDLDNSLTISPSLLKIVYYYYYNHDLDNKISLDNLGKFISNNVYKNKDIMAKISKSDKANFDRLLTFLDYDKVSGEKDAKSIAKILELDINDVNNILVYENKDKTNITLTLSEFLNFMNSDVLNNEEYSKLITKDMKDNLDKVSKFTKDTLEKEMNYRDLADYLDIDTSIVKKLFILYRIQNDIDEELTINNFVNFILNNLTKDSDYSSYFDSKTLESIKMLQTFSDKNIIFKDASISELSNIFNMSEKDILSLSYLMNKDKDIGLELTIKELVDSVILIKEQTNYLDDVDVSKITALKDNPLLYTLPTKFTATSLAEVSGEDKESICNLYALIEMVIKKGEDTKISPYSFVTFILNDKNNTTYLDQNNLNNLKLLAFIMNSTKENKTFTYKELSQSFNFSPDIIKSVYAIYFYDNLTLSPYSLVNFILDNKEMPEVSDNLQEGDVANLEYLNKIMTSIISNEKYNKEDLANFLDIPLDNIKLVYSLYEVNKLDKKITISLTDFINVILNNNDLKEKIDKDKITTLNNLNDLIKKVQSKKKYSKEEVYSTFKKFSSKLDKNLIDLIYLYYGSEKDYDKNYKMTIEEVVNFLNDDLIKDKKFNSFINNDMKNKIANAKDKMEDAKKLLVGKYYNRAIFDTKLSIESKETFDFIKSISSSNNHDYYVIGDSPMAYEMSQSFGKELNLITILTMLFIFVVVIFTFKSLLIPIILVLLIECAVFLTMGVLSFSGSAYFISILIVQSILMGATIDYAILYTSYYEEERLHLSIKDAITSSFNNSIHTILTSSSILVLTTLIIGLFSDSVASKICITLSIGCLCSTLLILILLPGVLAAFDKYLIKNKK